MDLPTTTNSFTSFRWCVLCQIRPQETKNCLCRFCSGQLSVCKQPLQRIQKDLGSGNIKTMISLWPYQDTVRRLILGIKIQNQYVLLQELKRLLGDLPTLTKMVERADALMPAPSSLWGRLRGRFDLAFGLTHWLSVTTKKPMVSGPAKLYARLRKQSVQKRQICRDEVSFVLPRLRSLPSQRQRILLIDDVMTSGQTCLETARYFPQTDFEVFTLADAIRPDIPFSFAESVRQ